MGSFPYFWDLIGKCSIFWGDSNSSRDLTFIPQEVESHLFQPLKGSRELTTPKRSQSQTRQDFGVLAVLSSSSTVIGAADGTSNRV